MAYDKNKKGGAPNRSNNFSQQAVQPKAPYNFVPFSDKVIVRYEEVKNLPDHDMIDPNLKSGEIHITMRAETPIFVSDGTKEAHFFRGANGKQMIPGSSVRGMVRNNMHILGFGKVNAGDDVADQQLFYRKVAAKKKDDKGKKSTERLLKDRYDAFLGMDSEEYSKGIALKVEAGILRRDKDDNGKYEIVQTKYYRLSRGDYKEWKDKYALLEDVFYTLKDNKVALVSKEKYGSYQWLDGFIMSTGKAVGNPNGIYLFEKVPKDIKGTLIDKNDVSLYEADLENRKTQLGDKEGDRRWLFWAMPDTEDEPRKEKPVFYVKGSKPMVWGMTMYPRIPYSKRLTDGLPTEHKKINSDGMPTLDYVKSILGFSVKVQDDSEKSKEKNVSYRSRVAFGDFEVIGKVREMSEQEVTLLNPKTSFYRGYTIDGNHYEDEFMLRGYKQYWLKDAKAYSQGIKSKIHPLPEGTEFHGVVKYKNLHEDELGLLLWAIQLEDGCYQSIGMAKPYGFGRVKISVDSLKEFDFAQRYTIEGLLGNGAKQSDSEQIQKYIESYQNCEYVKNAFGGEAGVVEQDEIKDFFCIHKKICQAEDVRYMTLPEYSKNTDALPSLEEIRKNGFKRDKKPTAPPKKKNNPPEEKVENAFAALKGLF